MNTEAMIEHLKQLKAIKACYLKYASSIKLSDVSLEKHVDEIETNLDDTAGHISALIGNEHWNELYFDSPLPKMEGGSK
jgi:hypothetical protein